MVACFLAVLVIAPMASAACLCGGDAIEQIATPAHVTQADHEESGSPCKAACCLGGHCHHAAPMLEASVTLAVSLVPVGAEHAAAPTRVLASRPLSALDRPPRA